MAGYLKEGRPPGTQSDPAVEQRVRAMLADIEREGESAVRRYSRELDGWDPPSFRARPRRDRGRDRAVPAELRAHIDSAADAGPRRSPQAQRATLRDLEVEIGARRRARPPARAGRRRRRLLPGGRYPLIASALMTVVVPKVAGVERVVACAPPRARAASTRRCSTRCARRGADEIYALGGVQALAAMAFGDRRPASRST